MYPTGLPSRTKNPEKETFSYLKTALIVIVILESDALLTSVVGADKVLMRWAYAALMVGSLFLTFFKLSIAKKSAKNIYFFYPILIFLVVFLVSAGSAFFIFPKPISDWLPSLYAYAPIFIFYFFYIIGAKEKELATAFMLTAVIISTLLLGDRLFNFTFLNEYQRLSSFFGQGARRIVLLKNEVIFGLVILASLIMFGKQTAGKKLLLIIVAVFLFFVQTIIMESRLGFLAIAVAFCSLLYLAGITKKSLGISVAAIAGALIILPTVFAQYIDKMMGMSISDDSSNIGVRIESIMYLFKLYAESNGWGVGMMSPTGSTNNVLYPGTAFNVADTGVFSSLGQFGILGFLLWFTLTFKCFSTFRKIFNRSEKRNYFSAACYAFLMSFTVSLLPLSLFTQAWNITMGGTLLYVLWLYNSRNKAI